MDLPGAAGVHSVLRNRYIGQFELSELHWVGTVQEAVNQAEAFVLVAYATARAKRLPGSQLKAEVGFAGCGVMGVGVYLPVYIIIMQ